jgi:hypothetical protein
MDMSGAAGAEGAHVHHTCTHQQFACHVMCWCGHQAAMLQAAVRTSSADARSAHVASAPVYTYHDCGYAAAQLDAIACMHA